MCTSVSHHHAKSWRISKVPNDNTISVALGWSIDQVIIINKDQGQSGKFSTDREGFQHLVAEVSLERAGIVMGLEVSRLARNSSDWHRLLEICALTNTLVLDDDGRDSTTILILKSNIYSRTLT
jgi:DNA invertase Pin-like site-specific DNA recombinase